MFALIIPCTVVENVVWHIKKKPGHLVNLGLLVGLEAYDLLCVALSTKFKIPNLYV